MRTGQPWLEQKWWEWPICVGGCGCNVSNLAIITIKIPIFTPYFDWKFPYLPHILLFYFPIFPIFYWNMAVWPLPSFFELEPPNLVRMFEKIVLKDSSAKFLNFWFFGLFRPFLGEILGKWPFFAGKRTEMGLKSKFQKFGTRISLHNFFQHSVQIWWF